MIDLYWRINSQTPQACFSYQLSTNVDQNNTKDQKVFNKLVMLGQGGGLIKEMDSMNKAREFQ